MFINNVWFLVYVSVGIFGHEGAEPEGPELGLPQGRIKGTYKKSYKGRTYSAFEGIPYATPPVGDLRFEQARPSEAWEGTLVANKSYMCLNLTPILFNKPQGTEDCLYVYVYVPRETIDATEKLDVVVHIHAGAFMMGSPQFLAGPKFIMDRDVVYVSMNYRLGILGFLSTEDEVVPGNNGLKDQSLALRWIKENVEHFGGNPNSITLTGLSAGGASVHYHYLSPMSAGLFHRGVSHSGTALQCWSLAEQSLANAQVVAKNVTCPITSTREMVDCMKKLDGDVLVAAVSSLFISLDFIPFAPFGPVVEKNSRDPFVDRNPHALMKEGKVYDVPWITSNTKDEGIYPVGFFVFLNKIKEVDEDWNRTMLYSLDLQNTVDENNQLDVMQKIREHYLGNEPLTRKNIFSLVEIFTDRLFTVDAEEAVRLHARAVKSPVYYYFFTYHVKIPNLFGTLRKGVAHTDDARLIYEIIGTPDMLEDSDDKMADSLTSLVSTYAKTGVPSFEDKKWSPVIPGNDDIDYLHIGDSDDISMRSVRHFGAVDFWKSLPIAELESAPI
ncbi:venom carboxylesterase-6-like isoform X2 [Cylas formicarius]|uniref:venom carboxylesterase-6-like isoform X2 n=1 Tax=Cylas formicarius TaxID=197179 RepID=UPI0029588C99|nr:venom carboxylesterase-6-like isoform X2 [Cylas formicarius]